jgi:hypothetical protein
MFSRVLLPITVEEYQVAQLWSTAQVSKENTGGGEGIEVRENKPFENKGDLLPGFNAGQYTHKLYKLERYFNLNKYYFLSLKMFGVCFLL